jgi:hypothetical protein
MVALILLQFSTLSSTFLEVLRRQLHFSSYRMLNTSWNKAGKLYREQLTSVGKLSREIFNRAEPLAGQDLVDESLEYLVLSEGLLS